MMNHEIGELRDAWRIEGRELNQGLRLAADARDYAPADPIPARVPSTVRTALLSAGRIRDPFIGKNSWESRWVEEKEWWFFRDFPTPHRRVDQRVLLRFEGVAYRAEVWVSGVEVGQIEGMFREAEFDVTELLETNRNRLAVRVRAQERAAEDAKGSSCEGLIRCDTHGLYFGPLMAEHDPLVLHRPSPELKTKYPGGGWMTGNIHLCFDSRSGHPREMTAPFVGGFEIVKLWDEHRDAAELAAPVFFGKPQVCDNPEEVSDDVDLVFIADCGGDGSDHLRLARPGLENGVPTFVDKPFADTLTDCRAILALSRKYHAPVFSLSILRAEPALARFRNRIPEVGEVNSAALQGAGTHPAGLVHTISATQHLFGPGIRSVQVLNAPRHTAVYLDYGERPDRPAFAEATAGKPKHGVMINCDIGRRPHSAVAVSVYGTTGDIHVLSDDCTHPAGAAEIVKMIKQMVLTRRSPPLLDEVLESIAVIEAFKKAKQSGQPEVVEDVYGGRNV